VTTRRALQPRRMAHDKSIEREKNKKAPSLKLMSTAEMIDSLRDLLIDACIIAIFLIPVDPKQV
jgi:hypothetical protein